MKGKILLALVLLLVLSTPCCAKNEIISVETLDVESYGYFCKFTLVVTNNTDKEFSNLIFVVGHLGATEEILDHCVRETAGLYPKEKRIINLLCLLPKDVESSIVLLHTVREKGGDWYEPGKEE